MNPAQFKVLTEGGPASPLGFTAGVAACGFKASGKDDLALVVSDRDCAAAGAFTRNRVAAAPVILDRETLAANADQIRAVVINAGNANACTGAQGLLDARAAQAHTAETLGLRADQVFVLSTGVIGVPLDMDKIKRGVKAAAGDLRKEAGALAARAMMTTDTYPKHVAISVDLPEGTVILGGMAKGAGMIHPDMATMLAVITTDAAVPPDRLQRLLFGTVDATFNCISIDGDTSTNDSVLMLANGASGVRVDEDVEDDFGRSLHWLCAELARAIVRDGEGASKFVTLQVTGAATKAEALQVARTVATSSLVKTALAGGDPNWGRILAAAGRSGEEVNPGRLALWVGSDSEATLQLAVDGGRAAYDEGEAARLFSSPDITLRLDLGRGLERAVVWTCDLTAEYVALNAEYRT